MNLVSMLSVSGSRGGKFISVLLVFFSISLLELIVRWWLGVLALNLIAWVLVASYLKVTGYISPVRVSTGRLGFLSMVIIDCNERIVVHCDGHRVCYGSTRKLYI